MPARAAALLLCLAVGGCSGGRAIVAGDDPGGDVAPTPTPAADGACTSQVSAFVRQVWLPTLQPICLACHVTHGLAQQAAAHFVLQDASQPGYLEANIAAVAAAGAQHTADGTPWLLAKPSLQVPHGGGLRLDPQSSGYAALVAYLGQAPFDPGCTVTMTPQLLAAVPQRSAAATLRRASLQLAARLPTPVEAQAAAAGDLDGALDSVLADPNFGRFVMRAYNDHMVPSDADNVNNAGIEHYGYDADISDPAALEFFYDPNLVTHVPGVNDHDVLQWALVSTGLQLARYLAMNDLPFTELLTADYIMLNPWSARALSTDTGFDLLHQIPWTDVTDPQEFRPVRLARPAWPMAGILTDFSWMRAYPTTATNHNRKRARMVYDFFLGFDILTLTQRPPDLNAILAASDPHLPATIANAACADCHNLLDPMAQTMEAYDDVGHFVPPDGNFGPIPMLPAGFEGTPMPARAHANPLGWLGQQVAADPRFPRAIARWWFTVLTGAAPLADPTAVTADLDGYVAAQRHQADFLAAVGAHFAAGGFRLRDVVKDIVASPYYRTADVPATLAGSDATMAQTLISPHLTSAVALADRLQGALGIAWRGAYTFTTWGEPRCDIFTAERLRSEFTGLLVGDNPTGITARIATAMGAALACQAVAADFAQPAASRTLFGAVTLATTPDTAAGSQAIAAVLATLHDRLLGPDSLDRDATLAGAQAAFAAGYDDARAAGDTALPADCQAGGVTADPFFTLHGWLAALTYLLTDPSLILD